MSIATLKMVTLDSSDARRDAQFWSYVLGWEVAHEEDEYAMLTGSGGIALGLGVVPGHEPPSWPNRRGTKQFHFDLAVDDLDAAAQDCVELGATLPDEQPGETWRVLLDPAGTRSASRWRPTGAEPHHAAVSPARFRGGTRIQGHEHSLAQCRNRIPSWHAPRDHPHSSRRCRCGRGP